MTQLRKEMLTECDKVAIFCSILLTDVYFNLWITAFSNNRIVFRQTTINTVWFQVVIAQWTIFACGAVSCANCSCACADVNTLCIVVMRLFMRCPTAIGSWVHSVRLLLDLESTHNCLLGNLLHIAGICVYTHLLLPLPSPVAQRQPYRATR